MCISSATSIWVRPSKKRRRMIFFSRSFRLSIASRSAMRASHCSSVFLLSPHLIHHAHGVRAVVKHGSNSETRVEDRVQRKHDLLFWYAHCTGQLHDIRLALVLAHKCLLGLHAL